MLHSGNTASGPLLSINDKYADLAVGTSKSVFVLGFGDLENSQLILDTRRKMFMNRPLKLNEYYANINCDISKKFILTFLVVVTRVTISADVMLVNDTISKSPLINDYITKLNKIDKAQLLTTAKTSTVFGNPPKTNIETDILINGDSVYYATDSKKYKLYTIASLDNETVILKAINSLDKNILTSRADNFYFKNFSVANFKNGDNVSIQYMDTSNYSVTELGKVIGVSNKNILVISKSGYSVLPTTKITVLKK
jgi:hypothetical protein